MSSEINYAHHVQQSVEHSYKCYLHVMTKNIYGMSQDLPETI